MLMRRSRMTMTALTLGLAPGFIYAWLGDARAAAGSTPTSSVFTSPSPGSPNTGSPVVPTASCVVKRHDAHPSCGGTDTTLSSIPDKATKAIREKVTSEVTSATDAPTPESAAGRALVHFGPAPALTKPTLATKFAPGAAYITRISHGQAKILKAFVAAPGLDGFAVQIEPGHDMILYTTINGRYLIMGGLFGPTGSNMSLAYAKTYLPASALKPTVSGPVASGPPPAILRKELLHLAGFEVGKPTAPKHLIMVIDPNCIFCDLTYKSLAPFIQAGSVRLTVIPEGFLKPSSIGKAEAILMSKNPAETFQHNELDFNAAEEEGGATPATDPTPAVAAEIAANTRFMPAHDINGTPFLIYTNTAGVVQAEPGMPKNIQAFLAGVSSKPTTATGTADPSPASAAKGSKAAKG
jgi:thiol:disulfide interchange protein DsbG